MSLTTGTRLGPFEILGSLGEGGMGEVYRARDTRLDRDVAIKILPEAFATDVDRLARFQREAKVLASLNHPNIGGIHGLEESAGVIALVMELVPGEDLSQRIARMAIPLDDALPIARQIADALEAAHEQGIIHRDLKPANIKVRPDGTVKVLDFGLAKALDPASASGTDVTASPTITSPAMTRAGMILGTAAYMSPEQARGRVVDRRADIWAFGAVVFEMLTARRPFEGDDIATTLAAVINKDPDWTALPAATPPRLSTLLRRCLKKDPKARLRDIGEARLQIDELLSGAPDDSASAPSLGASRSRRMLSWAALCLVIVVLATAAIITLRRADDASAAANPVQFTIVPLANTGFGSPIDGGTGLATQVAVSPDGRQIAFVAGARNAYQIYLRSLAGRAPVPLLGTEGGTFPFWSPDSQFIAFFAGGKLKKVSIAGGAPATLCEAQFGRGGSWNGDNVILFAPGQAGNTPGTSGLLRVSSQGGTPTAVTRVDPAATLTRHRWPYFLPDGRHFLYTEVSGPAGPASTPSVIRIGSLDSTEPGVTLVEAESSAVYGSGHILFVRDGSLFAMPFDPETRQAKGEAVRLAEQVSWEAGRYASVSLSQNGVLAYGHDYSQTLSELTWFDRTGRTLGTLGAPARYADLALSPDQKLVASSIRTGSPENRDIWIIDVARNVPTRLTTDPGIDSSPVWSPDSRRIAYSAQRSAKSFLRVQSIDGSTADESLFETTGNLVSLPPSSWSMDSKFIAHSRLGAFPRSADIWVIPTAGDRTPFPIANTAFLENSGSFSPDSRWIAYAIEDSGQSNVVVQSFPGGGGKYRVSQDGGSNPTWRADGKELFYLHPDGALMAVPIDADGRAGAARALFEIGTTLTREQFSINGQIYAATKDGERFLVNTRSTQSPLAPLTVLVNWVEAMQK